MDTISLNIIASVAIILIKLILLLIVMLLLREFGLPEKTIRFLVESKKVKAGLETFGDAVYGIGISILGAVLWADPHLIAIYSHKGLIGSALIVLGAYIRSKSRRL